MAAHPRGLREGPSLYCRWQYSFGSVSRSCRRGFLFGIGTDWSDNGGCETDVEQRREPQVNPADGKQKETKKSSLTKEIFIPLRSMKPVEPFDFMLSSPLEY